MKGLRVLSLMAIFTLSLLGQVALAGGIETFSWIDKNPWYFTLGGGYAWSTKGNIKVDLNLWDPAREGYDADLDQSPFITLGVGRRICPYFRAEITSSYFNDFRYRRAQTSGLVNIIGFTGTTRVRNFDLTNLNIMFNMIFSNENFSLNIMRTSISPFIGAGIGAAINTIHNFYTINSLGSATSIGVNATRTGSLAAQAEAGVSLIFSQNMMLDLGYRYYYGGEFKGPSRVLVNSATSSQFVNTSPWRGHLAAHLLFLEAHFTA